jgi:hypothetical protein
MMLNRRTPLASLAAAVVLLVAMSTVANAGPAAHAQNPSTQARLTIITGTIASFDTHSLTINRASGGSVSVTLGANTKFVVNGVATTSPTFAVGEKVRVVAQKQSNGSLLALQVVAGSEAKRLHPFIILTGAFSGMANGVITLTMQNNATANLHTLAGNTVYLANGVMTLTTPAFTMGQSLTILAQRGLLHPLTARFVFLGTPSQLKAELKTLVRIRGTVMSFSGGVLTLKEANGTMVTIQANPGVLVVANGRLSTNLALITVNERVGVAALPGANNSLQAVIVAVQRSST